MNRVEWMNGICRVRPRERLILPPLAVGDDWYLNLRSPKRSPGRNPGERHPVLRYDTASRGTDVLVLWVSQFTVTLSGIW